MLGTRQTGLLQFKVADLMRDADLLPAVRDAAQALLARWPEHISRCSTAGCVTASNMARCDACPRMDPALRPGWLYFAFKRICGYRP